MMQQIPVVNPNYVNFINKVIAKKDFSVLFFMVNIRVKPFIKVNVLEILAHIAMLH